MQEADGRTVKHRGDTPCERPLFVMVLLGQCQASVLPVLHNAHNVCLKKACHQSCISECQKEDDKPWEQTGEGNRGQGHSRALIRPRPCGASGELKARVGAI